MKRQPHRLSFHKYNKNPIIIYFIFRAGTPIYVPGFSIFLITTLPAPIMQSLHIEILLLIVAPAPIQTCRPMLTVPADFAPTEI